MKWLAIEAIVRVEDEDAVSLFFYEITGRGVECGEADSRPASVLVRGYLLSEEVEKVEALRVVLDPFAVAPVVVHELPETDWLQFWRSHYKTFRVGKNLVIRPPWEDYRPGVNDQVIVLDPGMAFGCGTHPTTQSCLELLELSVASGTWVYDVGTGSGILAIAAARLGAACVVAVDEDEIAVRVARENVAANGVESVVTVVAGDLLRGFEKPANVIVANIVADVIIILVPEVARCLHPGGFFIAGGITAAREAEVQRALEKFFSLQEVIHRGEWVAFRCYCSR